MDKSDFDNLIKAHDVKFIDLRYSDMRGKDHHITISAKCLDENFMHDGKMIDGSAIKGWQEIDQADLSLIPDLSTAVLDPFFQENTLAVRCNINNPREKAGFYSKDPRSVAKQAEDYLKSTGIADEVFFGPEIEFFMFDDVRFETKMHGAFYKINAEEGAWNSGTEIVGGNIGHRTRVKGGYCPVPPVDMSQDIRSTMCETLANMGIIVEAHHHGLATACQSKIITRFNTLSKKADEIQTLKYVVQNVAHNYGKSATFMPKPLVGDYGSGMHCHQSLAKNGVNVFAGDKYAGLSQLALYYIGGIIKHARALNAITNPAINSYRRLVPGYSAPVLLAYSESNRSASIRIPYTSQPRARRIEISFPDVLANPYLAFTAMMMAGLDGIKNRIDPGPSTNKNLYHLADDEYKSMPKIAASLDEAVLGLEKDHEFLLEGNVFSKDLIQSYINLCREDIAIIQKNIHPLEFEMYYSG